MSWETAAGVWGSHMYPLSLDMFFAACSVFVLNCLFCHCHFFPQYIESIGLVECYYEAEIQGKHWRLDCITTWHVQRLQACEVSKSVRTESPLQSRHLVVKRQEVDCGTYL